MSGESNDNSLDLSKGIALAMLADGVPVVGHMEASRIFVCRHGEEVHAFGVECPHLGAPLDEGLIEAGIVHCPWHHACFDLRTGEALAAPAFDGLARRNVDIRDGLAFVEAAAAAQPRPAKAVAGSAAPMVIVGGGAAGFAAADALRKGGWTGEIVMLSSDAHPPYDRTLLTKDYLDGNFGDDRLPIAWHSLDDLDVRLALDVPVESIDVKAKGLRLRGGAAQPYGKLLLATGAAPRTLSLPGAEAARLHYLRSLADCRRLLAALPAARNVVVLGSSFIGLEAAASLRSRGLAVTVVAPEERPMSKVFGEAISDLIIAEHRKRGVEFHFGRQASRVEDGYVILDDGVALPADVVLVGIGVEPRLELAKTAGLAIERGVVVDAFLRTSAPDIFAAGDIARWPDPHSGENIRVEHWVVAERQGQVAAANMLGAAKPFDVVPFFWTKHFDLSVHYVGHAEKWDEMLVDGSPADRDLTVRFRKEERDLAVATVGRDLDSLVVEQAMMDRLARARGAS